MRLHAGMSDDDAGELLVIDLLTHRAIDYVVEADVVRGRVICLRPREDGKMEYETIKGFFEIRQRKRWPA